MDTHLTTHTRFIMNSFQSLDLYLIEEVCSFYLLLLPTFFSFSWQLFFSGNQICKPLYYIFLCNLRFFLWFWYVTCNINLHIIFSVVLAFTTTIKSCDHIRLANWSKMFFCFVWTVVICYLSQNIQNLSTLKNGFLFQFFTVLCI